MTKAKRSNPRTPTGSPTKRGARKKVRSDQFNNMVPKHRSFNEMWEQAVLDGRSKMYRDLHAIYEHTNSLIISQALHELTILSLDKLKSTRALRRIDDAIAVCAIHKLKKYYDLSDRECAEVVVEQLKLYPLSASFDSAVEKTRRTWRKALKEPFHNGPETAWLVVPNNTHTGNVAATTLRDPYSGLPLTTKGILVRSDDYWLEAAKHGYILIDPPKRRLPDNT